MLKTFVKKITWWQWLIGVALFLLTPFPTPRISEWRLVVTDRSQQRISDVRVELQWKDYDNFQEGYVAAYSDSSGEVVFPTQWVWGNILMRIFFPITAKVLTLAHGSDGLSIFARVFDPQQKYSTSSNDQIHWYSNWDGDKPLPTVIVGTYQPDWDPAY